MTQVIRDKWKKPQWQGFSPTSEWSQIQMLGFRGPPGGCALYNLPSLVDTRRSSSVSQPDKSNFAGEAPSWEGPCNLSRPSCNIGYILFFKADPTLWTCRCPGQQTSKVFTKTLCHIHSKYCLMRPVMGRNCHTQGQFFVNPTSRSKLVNISPLFLTRIRYFSPSKYNCFDLYNSLWALIDKELAIMTQIHCSLWHCQKK